MDQLVLNQWEGGRKPSGKPEERYLCFFAHFDRNGRIDPHVVNLVKSIAELGTDIVFVSGSENLIAAEIEKITPYTIRVIQKKNLGLDFGSWKVAMNQIAGAINLASYQSLILANDSVYGPFFPLSDIFRKMEGRGLDFWAMTSNPEVEYHLQSYFLVFAHRVLNQPEFRQFWDSFRFFRGKWRIIQNYEIGLTRLAKEYHWNMGAVVEHFDTTRSQLNPTLFSWEELILKFRFPFLKTEVLRLNRGKSSRIQEWQDIISQAGSPYAVELIDNHLRENHERKEH